MPNDCKKNPNILVVDDDADTRQLMRMLLVREGYDVTLAADGRLALKLLEPGVFRSDPVLAADAQGSFYYSSLTSDSGSLACDLFVSATSGRNWYGL